MLTVIAAFGLSSCTEPREREEEAIAVKIQNKEKLTDKDYTVMIEYVGNFAEKAQPVIEDIINGNNVEEAQKQLDVLKAEYPAVNLFRDCIKLSPASAFNADNLALLQKYGNYIEFTMPLSIAYQTLPGTAGLEIQTPQDSANSVVAAPVLEAKEKKPEPIN